MQRKTNNTDMTLVRRGSFVIASVFLLLLSNNASAVPSFARQTGQQCATCHTTFPELTEFGRQFKLGGYTLKGSKQIEAPSSGKNPGLQLNEIPALSAMLEVGITNTKKTPSDTQNNSVAFPQELSVFYTGEFTPEIGSFIQLTYEQESDALGWDNADIRFADRGHLFGEDLVYGVTLNNSPTVQDPWNSTPVWGYPYSGSASAPAPANNTLLEGTLAQDVAGLGMYGMLDNKLYAELTLYRSAHPGSTQPDASSSNTINNVAPYWRLAWETSFDGGSSLMIGAYGMQADLYPSGVTGPTDNYSDTAVDTQYQSTLGENSFSLHATYITEKRELNATDPGSSPKLTSFKVDGTYYWHHKVAGSLAYFNTSGDENAVWATDNNKPDSKGWIAEVSLSPWQNTKFSAQYRSYAMFDGTSDNAKDNNTLYLLGWFVW